MSHDICARDGILMPDYRPLDLRGCITKIPNPSCNSIPIFTVGVREDLPMKADQNHNLIHQTSSDCQRDECATLLCLRYLPNYSPSSGSLTRMISSTLGQEKSISGMGRGFSILKVNDFCADSKPSTSVTVRVTV